MSRLSDLKNVPVSNTVLDDGYSDAQRKHILAFQYWVECSLSSGDYPAMRKVMYMARFEYMSLETMKDVYYQIVLTK
jgi:hypothetical protein